MHHIKAIILKSDEKKRLGAGFSREELKKAGVNLQEARRIELPIDMRRRTVHDDNVEAVKTYAEAEKSKRKPKADAPIEASGKASKRKA